MSLFTSDEKIQFPENVITDSPSSSMDGAFQEQKGLLKPPEPSIDYNMDMYQATQGNADSLYEFLEDNEKSLNYMDMIDTKAHQIKLDNKKKYSGLMSNLFDAVKHPGSIVQRITSKAIPESLVEGAMNTETYRRMLSVMQTAGENPDMATNILTSDSTINYIRGQADYLDNSMYEMYRNSDYRYLLNSVGMTGGIGVSTFLGLAGSTLGIAAATGTGIGTVAAGAGITALAGAATSLAIIPALVVAGTVLGGTLLYAGYKKLFDDDPYDDKSIGYNKDTQGLIDEFGAEEGLRILSSQNLRSISDILAKIKKLDRQKPSYKQRRKEMLNRINVLANDISEMSTEFSGTPYGSLNENSEVVSVLKKAGFTTTKLNDFIVQKSNEINKSDEIKKQFGVKGNSTNIIRGYDEAKTKAEKRVVAQYFGGNKESFLGEKLKYPEKIKALIDDIIPKHLETEINNIDEKHFIPSNIIADNAKNSIFEDKQSRTLIDLKSKLEQHILKKAEGIAENIAIKNLTSLYHRKSRVNGTSKTIKDFIRDNLEMAKKVAMEYSIGFARNIVQKDIKEGDFILPDGTNTQYLNTKPGTPKQSTYGLTIEDENMVSEINDELYGITNESTLKDYLGEKRTKEFDPIYKTPRYKQIMNDVTAQLQKYRQTAIDTFKRNHSFITPSTKEEFELAEKEAYIPETYRIGNAVIDNALVSKITKQNYNPKDFVDPEDPFKKIDHIHETFSTMAPLSNDALDVVKKHLIRSYANNKVREEELKKSDDFDYKINLVQQKRYKDLITINWINDLKYLRDAYHSGKFEGQEEIFGLNEMPTYWASRAESWNEDFLLGKIFFVRRTGSFAGRADIAASSILEIQKLGAIRQAFEKKYGEDNKVVKFIKDREDFYHNAIQHAGMATMLGKELYDRAPMFTQIIAEAPYDIMQMGASAIATKGLTSTVSKIAPKGKKAYSTIGQLGINIKNAFIDDPHNLHPGTVTGPFFRLAKHALGDSVEMMGITNRIKINAMAKAAFKKILTEQGVRAADKAKKYIISYQRQDVGKETANRIVGYISDLAKHGKKRIDDVGNVAEKIIDKEKLKTTQTVLEKITNRLDDWIDETHWRKNQSWFETVLNRDPKGASYATQEVLAELENVNQALDSYINQTIPEDVIKEITEAFGNIVKNIGTVPSKATLVPRLLNKLTKLTLKRQTYKNIAVIEEAIKAGIKNGKEQIASTRTTMYQNVAEGMEIIKHGSAKKTQSLSEINNMVKNFEKYTQSSTIKNLSKEQKLAIDKVYYITIKRATDSLLDMNDEAIKYYDNISINKDIISGLTDIKKSLKGYYDEIAYLSKTDMTDAKRIKLSNVFDKIRIMISGANSQGKFPTIANSAIDIYDETSLPSIPKLMNKIYSLMAEENSTEKILAKYKKYIKFSGSEGLSKKEMNLFKISKRIQRAGSQKQKLELQKVVLKVRKIMDEFSDEISTKAFSVEEIADIQQQFNIRKLWNNGKDYLNKPKDVEDDLTTFFNEAITGAFGKKLSGRDEKIIRKMMHHSATIPLNYKYINEQVSMGGQTYNYEGVLNSLSSYAFKNTDETGKMIHTVDNLGDFIKKVKSKAITKTSADYERDVLYQIQKLAVLEEIDYNKLQKVILNDVLHYDDLADGLKKAKLKLAEYEKDYITARPFYVSKFEQYEKYASGVLDMTEKEIVEAEAVIKQYTTYKSLVNKYEDLISMMENPTIFNAKMSDIIDVELKAGLTRKDVGMMLFGVNTDEYSDIQKQFVKTVTVPKMFQSMVNDVVTHKNGMEVVTATASADGKLLFTNATDFSHAPIVKEIAKKYDDTPGIRLFMVNTKQYSEEQLTGLIDAVQHEGYSIASRGADESAILFMNQKVLNGKNLDDTIFDIYHGMTSEQIKKLVNADKVLKRGSKIFSASNNFNVSGIEDGMKLTHERLGFQLQGMINTKDTKKVNGFLKTLGIGFSEKKKTKLKDLPKYLTKVQREDYYKQEYIKSIASKIKKNAKNNKSIFTEDHFREANAWLSNPNSNISTKDSLVFQHFLDNAQDNMILAETSNKGFGFIEGPVNKRVMRGIWVDENIMADYFANKLDKTQFTAKDLILINKNIENILGTSSNVDGAVLEGRLLSVLRRSGQNTYLRGTLKSQVMTPSMMTKENSVTMTKEMESFIDGFLDSLTIDKKLRFKKGNLANVYFKKSFTDMSEYAEDGKTVIPSYSIYNKSQFELHKDIRKARIGTAEMFNKKKWLITRNKLEDFYYLENLQIDPRTNPSGKLRETWGIFGPRLAVEQKGLRSGGELVTHLNLDLSKESSDVIRSLRRSSKMFTEEHPNVLSEEAIETAEKVKDELYGKTIKMFKPFLADIASNEDDIFVKARGLFKLEHDADVTQVFNKITQYIKKTLRGAKNRNQQKNQHKILTILFKDLFKKVDGLDTFEEIVQEAGIRNDDMLAFFNNMSELIHPLNHSNVIGDRLMFDNKVLSRNISNTLINSAVSKSMSEPGQYLTLTPDSFMLAGGRPLNDFEAIVPPSFKGLGFVEGDELIMTVFPTESTSRLAKVKIAGFSPYEGTISLNAQTTRRLARDFDGDGVRLYYRPVSDQLDNGFGKAWLPEIVNKITASHERPGFNFMSDNGFSSGLNNIRQTVAGEKTLQTIATKILTENSDSDDYINIFRKAINEAIPDSTTAEFERMKIMGTVKTFVDTENNIEWKTMLEFIRDGYTKSKIPDMFSGMSERARNVLQRNLVGAVDNDSEGVFMLINLLKHFTYDDDKTNKMIRGIKLLIDNELGGIGINSTGYAPYGGQFEYLEELIGTSLQSAIDMMNGGVNGIPVNVRHLMALKRSGMKKAGKDFSPLLGYMKTVGDKEEYVNPARQIKDMLLNALRKFDENEITITNKNLDTIKLKAKGKNIFRNFLYYVKEETGETVPTEMLEPAAKKLNQNYNLGGFVRAKQESYRLFREKLNKNTKMATILKKFKHLSYIDRLIDEVPLDNPMFAKSYGFLPSDPSYGAYDRGIDRIVHQAMSVKLHNPRSTFTPLQNITDAVGNMENVDKTLLYRLSERTRTKNDVGRSMYKALIKKFKRSAMEYTDEDISNGHRMFSNSSVLDGNSDFLDSAGDTVRVQITKDALERDTIVNYTKNYLSDTPEALQQRKKGFIMLSDFLNMAEDSVSNIEKRKYITMAGELLADLQSTFKGMSDDIMKNTVSTMTQVPTTKTMRIKALFDTKRTAFGHQFNLYYEFLDRLDKLDDTAANLTRDVIQPMIKSIYKRIEDINPNYATAIFDGMRNHEALVDAIKLPQFLIEPEHLAYVRRMVGFSGGVLKKSKIHELLAGKNPILFKPKMTANVIDQMPTSNYWRQLAHEVNPDYINDYIKMENIAFESFKPAPITANRDVLRTQANLFGKNNSKIETKNALHVFRASKENIIESEKKLLINKGFASRLDEAQKPIMSLSTERQPLLNDKLYKTISKATDTLKEAIDPATKHLKTKLSLMIGDELGEGVVSNLTKGIAKFVSLYKAFRLSLPGGGLRFAVFNGIENTYKTMLYMMDNINDGYQLKTSHLLDLNRYKGNANEIISQLMFFDDLGKGFNKTDPNKLWRTIEGSRTINLFNKISANTEHMFTNSTEKWYGRLLDNIAKVNSRYLQWTGDNFETPFRNKVFSDKFMREFIKASSTGFNPNDALNKAARAAWKTTDEIFFDYSNKIGAFSGANQILYPFGDFRFKNANYWATQFANNPLLMRGVMHTLPYTRLSGKDPRQGKVRMPASDMYINPFSLLSFNDFMRHTIAKPAFTQQKQRQYELLYKKVKGMPEEQQRAFAFRQKDGPEVLAYFQYRHIKPFAQMFRVLDDYLGMSSIVKGTANTIAGFAFNGRMFKPDDYKGEYGALLELVNAWWPGKEVNQPIGLMRLMSPHHTKYLKKQATRKTKSIMKTMNMSEEEAKAYLISIERWRQVMAFMTGMFPTVVTNESANYIKQISSWKKGVKPYADDTYELQSYLMKADLPDVSAYRLFDSTKHALENPAIYDKTLNLIPVNDMGKLAYLPIANLKDDSTDSVTLHMAAAANPFYLNDYKNVVDTPELEKIQYIEYGLNSAKFIKEDLREEYYHRRGLSNTKLHKLFSRYFSKNYYESLKTTREYLRSQSGGVPYTMLDEKYIEDMKYVDRLQSRIKNYAGITPSVLDGIKDDYPGWAYDYATKRYVSANWNDIDWTEPNKHARKGIINLLGKKNYLKIAAGYSLSKNHGKEIKSLTTFDNEKDINSTAFSPSKMSQMNPILRKKLEMYVPELEQWSNSGKDYYNRIMQQSGLSVEKKPKEKINIPRQLETFAKKPTRKMIKQLNPKSLLWIKNHGFIDAFNDSMETGNMSFLGQQLQKYLKFRNA